MGGILLRNFGEVDGILKDGELGTCSWLRGKWDNVSDMAGIQGELCT